MQALTHAAKTGVLEGRIWGRLGKPCAVVQLSELTLGPDRNSTLQL